MRHTINAVELDEWLRRPQWQMFASSAGPDTNKRFEVDTGGVFRVTDHGETIFLGADKIAAIDAYNSAR